MKIFVVIKNEDLELTEFEEYLRFVLNLLNLLMTDMYRLFCHPNYKQYPSLVKELLSVCIIAFYSL